MDDEDSETDTEKTLDEALEQGVDAAEAAAKAAEEDDDQAQGGDGTGDEDDEGTGDSKGSEGDGEEQGDGDEDPGEDGVAADEVEGLTEKGREKINRKIGKMVRKRHEAEEARTAAETKATEAEARAEKAEKALESKMLESAFAMGLAPEYVTEEESKLLSRAEYLEESRAFLLEHFDGYEGSDEKNDPSYTAPQIRARYAEVDRELQKVGPKAAALKESRTKQMLEHMKVGRLLAEKGISLEDALKPKPAAKKDPKTGKTQVTDPPPLPRKSGGDRKPPVSVQQAKGGFDAKAVMENPSPEALESQFEKLF